MSMMDVVIIGAGAIGTAIARELSKYELNILVVDKNEDVGGDASKSNSGIVHTGYDATPGTLESRMVVAANPMYDKLVQKNWMYLSYDVAQYLRQYLKKSMNCSLNFLESPIKTVYMM
jgi:L-2-hydroxyglutarate oxidase LhgO